MKNQISNWERTVLAAWLRRNITGYPGLGFGTTFQKNPDYHPPKAHKIYVRYQKIIDAHC